MLLVQCETPVPAERTNAWVKALAAQVQAAHMLVISSIPVRKLMDRKNL